MDFYCTRYSKVLPWYDTGSSYKIFAGNSFHKCITQHFYHHVFYLKLIRCDQWNCLQVPKDRLICDISFNTKTPYIILLNWHHFCTELKNKQALRNRLYIVQAIKNPKCFSKILELQKLSSSVIFNPIYVSEASKTFMICCLINFVASPALAIMNRSIAVMAMPASGLLFPYLNVMNSGWRFFDVIFNIDPSILRLCIQAMPFWSLITRKTYRCESVTHRKLKDKIKLRY